MEFDINNFVKILIVAVLITIASGCNSLKMEFENKHQIELDVLEAFKGLVDAVESLDSNRYFEYFDK